LRRGEMLRRILPVHNFVSPRLGIRFDLSEPEMVVYYPDGQPFITFEQLKAEQQRERQLRLDAEQRAEKSDRRAEEADRRAEQADRRVARLAELSLKLLQQQATAEELQELDQLTKQPPPA